MSSINNTILHKELQQYGVPEHSVKSLQHPSPDLLDYLDLIEGPSRPDISPDYVVENQGKPLLYVVNEAPLAQSVRRDEDYKQLRHALACKGQRAYLACLRPGELRVVPVDLQGELPWKVYKPGSDQTLNFFPRLALGHYDGQGDAVRGDYVFEEMFQLLSQVADQLVEVGLQKPDVLSLVGRALFFRFLLDRKIISDNDVDTIAPNAATLEDCFRTIGSAASTCQWLDATFNGDFLTLSGDLLDILNSFDEEARNIIFHHLSAIARAYKAIGHSSYQLQLRDQDDRSLFAFDFAHVPVGLLSQVYEKFAWKWDYEEASSTSVHYTPRNIAAMMVEEVFDGLPNASECRILDPACGAGVFLVLAFRRLYSEQWKANEVRPGTEQIRNILMTQLTGFDISESALKLAALSLYLTAIELDPEPVPPQKLKFNNLRNSVLFNFRRKDDPVTGPVAGSLHPEATKVFKGQFDLILSNPPWTAVKGKKFQLLADMLNAISKQVVEARGSSEQVASYHNPDRVPDLPFLWKATEWCKPGGRIAMALHARLLLKQGDIASRARKTLFRLLEINGIINGSNLTGTQVWSDMNQPFILLFASNKQPQTYHTLHFVTPHHNVALNKRGEMWIDSQSATPIEVEATFEESWLWKALTVGTSLDVEIVRKIKAINAPTMKTYWEIILGLRSSSGYKPTPGLSQIDASHLKGLPNLSSQHPFRFHIQTNLLDIFTEDSLGRPREREVYRAPLMLLKLSPGADRRNGWALLGFEDVAYNESYHGYSAYGHPEAKILVRYIHLFVHSNIWMHYALLTSPKFGAERRQIYKEDIDECPIIPFENLTYEEKQLSIELSERLINEDMSVFDEIDSFFAQLYGLDRSDLETIRDTLAVSFPYGNSRKFASSPPSYLECDIFRYRLKDLLQPFFQVVEQEPLIEYWQLPSEKSPYITLLITAKDELPSIDKKLWLDIVQIAEQTGATRIFQEVDGCLLLAILNQYRYWTPTRARLCAAEIIRRYIDIFEE